MNITPKLNLNKHPKDSTNLSLVNALHVKVSQDESCITSEDSIKENVFINAFLEAFYTVDYKIVGVIPCNNELIIIAINLNTPTEADIFRYQEPINDNIESMYCAYGGIGDVNRFSYSGGLIKGAFTYNVENSLIVAITEYGVPNVKIPLRTINLGNSGDPTVYNDKDLPNSKLSISPELKIPSVRNLDYISGGAYKGWYYMFLRYKINSVDYTQWHSVGTPIYIDTLEQYQIVRYCYNRDTKFASSPLNDIVLPPLPDDGYGAGCSDYFSNTSDIAKETFKVDLYFDNSGDYDKYQIGLVCASKSYTKAFRTADIHLDSNYVVIGVDRVQKFVLDNKSLIEYTVDELVKDNFNYFNSKNVINYQNRLYISNYLEDNANNDDIPQYIIDGIDVNLLPSTVSDYGLVYDTALITNGNTGINQYDTYRMVEIPLHVYLDISEETVITITEAGHPTKTAKAGQFYIVSGGSLPAFAYIELREHAGLGIIDVTEYGKEPDQQTIFLTIPNAEGEPESNIIFDPAKIAMDGGMRYTNTNISFNNRKKADTLIPGEIYNFFVHFTNKYNDSSNGYKLLNKTVWDTEAQEGIEIVPIPFNIRVGTDNLIYYAAAYPERNVAVEDFSVNSGYNIETTDIRFYKSYTTGGSLARLLDEVDPSEEAACRAAFIEHFSSYADVKHLTTKWYQISYGPGENKFHLFINDNGDRLFKCPTMESFTLVWDGFPDEVEDFKTRNLHSLLKLSFSNIEIPEGYDGYYFSYEKFESHSRATGLLTRNDFRSQDYIVVGANEVNRNTLNNHKSDKMFFYSGIYDISDTIKLDYNIMRVEAVNCFKKTDIPEWDYMQRNYGFGFVHDMNKPQTETYGADVQKTYAIPEYKLSVANSAADNRMGLGTALQIKDAYNLFDSYDTTPDNNGKIKLYRVTLLNTTRAIYMSNTKSLVKFTDVYYRATGQPVDFKHSTGYIDKGYNGHYTYDGMLIYENGGSTFNTANNRLTSTMGNTEYYHSEVNAPNPHTYENDYPFLAYLQLPICTDIFFESKSFKSAPTGVIYTIKTTPDPGSHTYFAKGCMVTPANSIDLFENRQGSADQFNPKTYVNFRDDLVSVEQFDKTVRRSNVIQDESRVNGWRTFPVEGYKNIAENKGKITNLIGIGSVLLVHTEHSLFMFNTDNTLRTRDQDIQLAQPDAFEIGYREVFTSDKGFGGLQDDKSFSIDQFGYIFYSNDTNRIYLFDNNQLDYIDEDILQWLTKYRPINIRFANDKRNNRLLIKFDYIINGITKHTIISYSYKVKSFICQHKYYFDESYNTKTGLYMQCNNEHTGCSLHNFDYASDIYGIYDNVLGSLGVPTILEGKLSIICNADFEQVKFLEFITYKLTKYIADANIDFTHSPVEEYIEPFAGNTITIYNNMINTGILDINVINEATKNMFADFDKPYWDLGVWNFSYLRNRISELPDGISATEMSRIFGNYFIIEFVFNNLDGRRIDFEELNYSLSQN